MILVAPEAARTARIDAGGYRTANRRIFSLVAIGTHVHLGMLQAGLSTSCRTATRATGVIRGYQQDVERR